MRRTRLASVTPWLVLALALAAASCRDPAPSKGGAAGSSAPSGSSAAPAAIIPAAFQGRFELPSSNVRLQVQPNGLQMFRGGLELGCFLKVLDGAAEKDTTFRIARGELSCRRAMGKTATSTCQGTLTLADGKLEVNLLGEDCNELNQTYSPAAK
jgi:hypothetical protein